MTRDRLIEEATDVIWVERTKGGYRAATHMERMLAELRRLWDEEERRLEAVVRIMRERKGGVGI